MLVEDGFDFLRGDVASTADDDLFLAPGKPVEAVRIAASQISGMEPVTVESGGCGFRILPITDHQVRALDADLSYFARASTSRHRESTNRNSIPSPGFPIDPTRTSPGRFQDAGAISVAP